MAILINKHMIGLTIIIVTALFVVCFLTIAVSYFNTVEISSASAQCYEIGGEVVLEIHNNFTNSYSFECIKGH